MEISHLKGLIAAPFTPMLPDGSLNLSLIPDYYELLKANGVTGAFICGSTGEGVSMSLKEKKAVAEAWAACTQGDEAFKVMLFLGGTSLADCKELALYAQQIGLDAISFTAPFYFKPANVEMLAQACKEVADVVPTMPFYYYHIPVLTGVGFAMYDLLQVIDGQIENFAGIKYTHEDFMDYQSCLSFQNQKYDMLWGRDENMLSALVLGAKGAVGSTFNYAAPLYHRLIEAFNNHDLATARHLQLTSINMIRLLGKYGGIATGKAYMKMIGLDCGMFRLPIRNMTDAQFENFMADVNGLNFSTFCSKNVLSIV
ncbi:MAG: dihydrodipicolinate synthase family protein [Spirosomataceae bacterium]